MVQGYNVINAQIHECSNLPGNFLPGLILAHMIGQACIVNPVAGRRGHVIILIMVLDSRLTPAFTGL